MEFVLPVLAIDVRVGLLDVLSDQRAQGGELDCLLPEGSLVLSGREVFAAGKAKRVVAGVLEILARLEGQEGVHVLSRCQHVFDCGAVARFVFRRDGDDSDATRLGLATSPT